MWGCAYPPPLYQCLGPILTDFGVCAFHAYFDDFHFTFLLFLFSQERPYVIKKSSASNPPTKTDFEGFIPDLLNELASQLNFDYDIKVVQDGRYGKESSGGNWNGIIGEVQHAVSESLSHPA